MVLKSVSLEIMDNIDDYLTHLVPVLPSYRNQSID